MRDLLEDLRKFQRLCEQRDLAALNCVHAVQFVLAVFEAQDFADARQHLERALELHQQADQAVSEFHLSHIQQRKKENSNGNDHAQSIA